MQDNLLSQRAVKKLSPYDKYILASANLACAKYHSLSRITRKKYIDRSLSLLASIDLKNSRWRRLTAKCYLLKADLQYLLNSPQEALENYQRLEHIISKPPYLNNDSEKTLLALAYIGMTEALVKIEENCPYPNYHKYLLFISKAIGQLNSLKNITSELAHILYSTYKSLAILFFSSSNYHIAADIMRLQFNGMDKDTTPDFIEISNQIDLLEIFNTETYSMPPEYNPYFTLLEIFDESILFVSNYLNYSFGSITELLAFCLKSRTHDAIYSADTMHDIINYTLYAIKHRKKLPNPESTIIQEFNDPILYKKLVGLVIKLIDKTYIRNKGSFPYSDIIFRINKTSNYGQLFKKRAAKPISNIYNFAYYKDVAAR